MDPRSIRPRSYCHSYLLSNFCGQLSEVFFCILYGTEMAADGSIRRRKIEDGFAMFLSHWDQAAVVLNRSQTVRVVLLSYAFGRCLIQYRFPIHCRNALYPLI